MSNKDCFMKQFNHKFTFALTIAMLASTMLANGQLFTPLGLGIDKCERKADFYEPQMHVEGDTLYVCTKQGLYSRSISIDNSTWQLAGFEGIPLQDYVRNGNDIIALRHNVNGNFLLLSHDGGSTYDDITPDLFTVGDMDVIMVMKKLIQHPSDPNTLLVSSDWGLFQSSDFGQTWSILSSNGFGYIGFHPLNPEVLFSDENYLPFNLYTSYNGGQSWNDVTSVFSGDNSIKRIAFHPTDANKWIVGGSGAVYTSSDNGQTWNTKSFSGDAFRNAIWCFTAYDSNNSDVIYMAGRTNEIIEVMCSADGGKTWCVPQTESMKKSSLERINDMKQSGGKLFIYTESDVYELSKELLLSQTASAQSIAAKSIQTSSEYFDLLGRKIDTPSGLTIVVTRYSDGTIRTEKKLFK